LKLSTVKFLLLVEYKIHDCAMKCIFDQHCNVNNFFLLTRRFRRSIQQETGGKRPPPGERVEFSNLQQIHVLCVH
ncbi:hypothetical protein T11_12674, partial [Trichinella zimbabwensis]